MLAKSAPAKLAPRQFGAFRFRQACLFPCAQRRKAARGGAFLGGFPPKKGRLGHAEARYHALLDVDAPPVLTAKVEVRTAAASLSWPAPGNSVRIRDSRVAAARQSGRRN